MPRKRRKICPITFTNNWLLEEKMNKGICCPNNRIINKNKLSNRSNNPFVQKSNFSSL